METITKENKELLLKDLCTRLPYGVKVQMADRAIEELLNVNVNTFICNGLKGLPKPYLFPLSNMTEEQKKELKDIIDQTIVLLTTRTRNEDYGIDQGKHHFDHTLELDWLNKNHFDYRGLIEKGLALNATELNIY